MSGYIISNKKKINIKKHKIQSFDILCKTNLNIHIVKDNKICYVNDIIKNASYHGHIDVLEWFKMSGYEFKIENVESGIMNASKIDQYKILEWFKNIGYNFNKITLLNNIIFCATLFEKINVLKWIKKNKYFKYDFWALYEIFKSYKIFKFYVEEIKVHSKKIIILSPENNFVNTYQFKTKNNYIKGYNKN